ncbi:MULTISPECIES: UvrD-helicase domain-containing protein [Pseudomonas syringae group]|uniref:DNA 3'-5' helicase n=1 Tax=Pseudomonas syringae Cit 7 TaxID=629264 RepID=A0A8T8M109_PSESX|nr:MULTISPECIES: UvrD-helicase domain-containing protein [Pseudomonas syringae group]PYD04445.1 ATP-dependent helicase [Pseudomonas syringae pv. maculicola]MBL3635571.1 ATP-dependent helicase [Pseudomonas syringae pv. actinidiae]MCQ9391035.1 UvrD-helicase domain-containing protein [Pseudomonas viridiflava]MCZ0945968.1 UvrD-helicase domain-containing protein [Pseudomonas syringae pv. tomato]MDU8584090.1 UvrD-helicase domain-containing protein [Pseudomonas syringae pv. actinidiae]
MQWTEEQQPAIHSSAKKLLVQAFAGTGKTTTLVGYASHNAKIKMLYLCYNKAVEMAAKNRFPRNVTCKTAHGLAYAVYGSQYKHKQAGNLRLTDIARTINTQDWELAKDIVSTLNAFMASSDLELIEEHFVRFQSNRRLTSVQQQYMHRALDLTRDVWGKMVDVQDRSVSMTHDGYLKLYQMSQPDLSQRFGAILLDEGQDVNPVIANLVQIQNITQVTVGDRHQQLYRFRGAVDALNSPAMIDAEKHFLTQSFRFGPAVAYVANVILSFKGETIPLQGLGQQTLVKRALPADLPHRTYLHRTVSGVIENALRLVNQDHKMQWLGGIDSYSLRDLEDLFYFSRGMNDQVQQRKLLSDYADYDQYVAIAKATQDPEMLRSIKIIENYPDLPQRIDQLRRASVTSELDATVTLSTAHRAKGLEWDFVGLYEDFTADPLSPDIEAGKRDDELNLLYVSVTRAMKILAVNSLVIDIMQRFKDQRSVIATNA